MNDRQVRNLDAFKRMHNFMNIRGGVFASGTTGKQLFDDLGLVIEEIENRDVERSAADVARRQQTANKEAAERALVELLHTVRRTSRSLPATIPNIEERFIFNQRSSTQTLIGEARRIAGEVVKLKAEFIKLEMPATLVEDIGAAIDNVVNADREQDTFEGARKSAIAALDAAFERGKDIRRRLASIVTNRFAAEPDTRADWERACHVERSPRSKKDGGDGNNNAGNNTPPAA